MQRVCSVLLPLFVASAFALTSDQAIAEDIEESVELGSEGNHAISAGVFAGALLLADDHEFYDPLMTSQQELSTLSADIGLRLGYLPIPYVGVELEGNLSFPSAEDGSSTTLFGVRGQVIGQMPMKVTPFVLAGFGVMGIRSDADALDSDTDPVGHFGAGAKYRVASNWVARADLRLLVAPRARALDRLTTHGEFLLGLSYDFGKREKREALPADLDGDGFIGAADQCPSEAGPAPDGCPLQVEDELVVAEPLDSDGDGIVDATDACPKVAEDMDSFEDEDGCPEDDNDKDSVVDTSDRCPLEAGPVENRGCPDTDRDGDTVVDRLDNCPDVKGSVEEQGCTTKQRVVLTSGTLEILDKVYFKTGKDIIQKRSYPILNNVAEVIGNHSNIAMVRIEGHTDDIGEADDNLELSQKRAEAVARYLVSRGVAFQRLTPKGFGEEVPAEEGTSKSARQSNRRVEFKIVEQ